MKQIDKKEMISALLSGMIIMSLGAGVLADETEVPEETEVTQEEQEIIPEGTEDPDEEEMIGEEPEEMIDPETEEYLPEEIVEVEEDVDISEEEEIDVLEVQAASLKGWIEEGGDWYYFVDGEPVTGWQTIKGKKYHFNAVGIMSTGFMYIQESDGSYGYLFDENGHYLTGWQEFEEKWYYLGSDGRALSGWQKINKKWYYFSKEMDDGKIFFMVTGFKKIDGSRYYFNDNGAMQTGWIKVYDYWYYADKSGALYEGGKRSTTNGFTLLR